ncbi:hypothetical protein [Gorillibacterium sp. sgz5001074]|uniref:hypothetical protein n=1 Tax=Gorillibacterium sp. sgz5001074 TaxID=3446695 RepID=UPI003F6813D0
MTERSKEPLRHDGVPLNGGKNLTIPNKDIQAEIDNEQAEALVADAAGDRTAASLGNE